MSDLSNHTPNPSTSDQERYGHDEAMADLRKMSALPPEVTKACHVLADWSVPEQMAALDTVIAHITAQADEIERLEAERDRYKDALGAIFSLSRRLSEEATRDDS